MFIFYANLPNALTFSGLTVSILACILSFHNALSLAMICLMMAGIFDLFDGLVARKMKLSKEEKDFGAQLDSISDMACFGIVPVVIAMHSGLNSGLDFAIMAFYGCCAATRLAYFNVHGTSVAEGRNYYTGLPVTYAALIFPLVFLFTGAAGTNIIRPAFVCSGILFISKIKIRKPHGVYYFIFPILAGTLSLYWLFGVKTGN